MIDNETWIDYEWLNNTSNLYYFSIIHIILIIIDKNLLIPIKISYNIFKHIQNINNLSLITSVNYYYYYYYDDNYQYSYSSIYK